MLLAKIAMNFWHGQKTVEPGPKPVKFLRADDIRGSPPLFPKKKRKRNEDPADIGRKGLQFSAPGTETGLAANS